MACAVRSSINKWDQIKLQRFCKVKDTVNKTKIQPTDWEKKTEFSTNAADSTGSYHVEECELIHSYLLVQSSSLRGSKTST